MIAQLFLDIETIPAQRPDVLAEIRDNCKAELETAVAAVKPPSNYGADAATKWWMEKGNPQITALQSANESTVEEAYRKTGLDGAFGQIACVSYAYLDAAPVKLWVADWQDEKWERDLLMALTDSLNETIPRNMHRAVQVVGHHVAAFDLRFIVQRSIVRGIRPHPILNAATEAKPWDLDRVYDTMVQWAGVGRTVSLDKLCKALGLPGKGDMDGSKVWDYVKAGRIAEVAEYCADDVRKVRAVYRRMTFATAPVQQFDDVAV